MEELEEAEDEDVDIKDVDFRLRNDTGRVRQLLESSQAVSYKVSFFSVIKICAQMENYGLITKTCTSCTCNLNLINNVIENF